MTAKNYIFQAAVRAAAAFFCFTVMQACAKLLTGRHDVFEIAFYRNIVSITPMLIYLGMTQSFYLLRTDKPGVLALRVIIGTIGLVLTFASAQAMPLAEATVLFFTSALLIPVLSFFFLKEHVGPRRWIAIMIGFCGVWIAAHPSGTITAFALTLGLAAAATHAIVQVLLRAMREVPAFTVTFYFFLGGIVLPGLLMPFVGNWPTGPDALILLTIGIFGGLGQYFLTTAFQSAPASVLAPINYSGLIWATGLDILIWGSLPGWGVFAGALLIMGAQLYIIHREHVAAKPAAKNLPPVL